MLNLTRKMFLLRTLSTRAAIQKSLDSVKKTSPSRSAQVGVIQRKLADYEREKLIGSEQIESEYATESMLGEQFLRDAKGFEKVLQRRQAEQKKDVVELNSEGQMSSNLSFPLKPTTSVNVDKVEMKKLEGKEADEDETIKDRGFYIEAGVYVDEYVAGSSLDIDPGDDVVSSRQYYGDDDAVEVISFQQPGQSLNEGSSKGFGSEGDGEEALEAIGTIDENRPASKNKCSGCGANFHCKDSSLPGFLPLEVFEKMEKKRKRDAAAQSLCKRCHLLQKHNFLLNVNVCEADYTSMMSQLRASDESLVILVVDVTDLPGSIHPNLAELIGSRKPMIVVGNKVDLLPPDAECGYMHRFKKGVEYAVEKAGLTENFNILHTALVSAKTGYGVEELITEIYLKYTTMKMGVRGDMFLVGCTNAGKSTMFNALLQSDLCKVRAVDLVDRATTSIWPGTTMSLLKFPVMKPSPYRLEMRRRRLIQHRAWLKKEMYSRKLLLQQTGDSQYAVPIATIQNSFKEDEEELQPIALDTLSGDGEPKKKRRSWSLEDDVFAKGKWCFDTPGTVNCNQLLALFTLDELVNVVPRRLLRPRTAILKQGESLVIGGVARIDVEKTDGNVLLTTFANDALPLNVMATDDVEKFFGRYLGTAGLVVPRGNEERMKTWPEMKDRLFDIRGRKDEGCCDVVLSSLGWVMVNSERNVSLRAHIPDGKGLTARTQPLLPYSASLRGKRIPGTKFYKVQPIAFPVNKRRKIAEARKREQKKKEKMEEAKEEN